jgi:4-hydroxy-2-oxoheptanedioate aldolase
MNQTGTKMLEILKELRDDCGVLAVKAEFEAEGSRTDEMIMLDEVIQRADMKLVIKIGGCEAMRDLDQCRILGASGIMGPMIETPFAMEKYVGAAKKIYGDEIDDIEWIINTETITCHQNLDAIMDVAKGFLKTIAIGRVNLSSSMGLDRSVINGDEVFEIAQDFAKRARAAGLTVGFGGGISFDAIPFIIRMAPLADKFETRKIVFSMNDDEKQIKKGIIKAMEFETLYLQNKCEFYDRMANEDRARLKMLDERLKKAQAELG